MRFDVKAAVLTGGVIWGGLILLAGLANLIWSGYAQAFLDLVASLYPGYHAEASFGQVIVGTLYGLLDGAICGALVALLYNAFAAHSNGAQAPVAS